MSSEKPSRELTLIPSSFASCAYALHVQKGERIEEHERDSIFRNKFNEYMKSIREETGGTGTVVTDLDLSNMDIGPEELKDMTQAVLDHFKLTGKGCFVRHINLSGNRICGFDYKRKPPPISYAGKSYFEPKFAKGSLHHSLL